jgi:glycosyltransferase involved in cell wall biosynthesis
MDQPFVSVVTPFYNTAPYLAECIESVLAQSYTHFEYILSDNCSTDGSGEIAASYARRDPRIRLIRQERLLSQEDHYNSVLRTISVSSQYCKIVQADDLIFPECLAAMVRAFERSASIGLVSSYYLKGDTVLGSGFPHGVEILKGGDMARLFLRTGLFVFGSESTVMYRASMVCESANFLDGSLLHADTEKCLQILQRWEFGFVHQVLSFLRMDNMNESISTRARDYRPRDLDNYITTQRYAPAFLDADEAALIKRRSRRSYYHCLALQVLRLQGTAAFWRYHQQGLKTLGETVDIPYLSVCLVGQLLWTAVNPGLAVARVCRFLRRKLGLKPPAPQQSMVQLKAAGLPSAGVQAK